MADDGSPPQGGGRRPGDPVQSPGPGDLPVPPASEGRRISRARTAVRLLPVLLIAAGGVYDYYTPSKYSAAPLFTAAPLVAAPLYSRRGTVLTGFAATVVVLAVHLVLGGVFDVDAVTELVTVVTVSALAVLINTLVRRSSEQLASAREIAEAAQRAVLPEPVERIGGFQIAARYEAAQADASIGGDLYAVQDSPHGVRLIVGDVRGKGLGAVSAVAVVIGAFREAAEQEATLEAVAQRLERALVREGARRGGVDAFEGFTTAVLAELPHGDGPLRILNRGHPPPMLLYADGTVRALLPTRPALPLGMGELGAWPDRADGAGFPSGATLLLYTDGVSETRDPHGRFYDVEERLEGRVCGDPGTLLAAVARDVRRHSGGHLTDDMALLAVRRP
ncbi:MULTISPECIES: PP2C family protein-serine/threonine phosphatase [unclassified Streptomyces]|uniref:PP2C family protein-serine/threonine phosphatase n=1 Tax=unclassified Streptomyces TaxID=2593676 RepID=UPI001F03651F|nr:MULTISPECIES: PP2C family protein-serine/threonine phosphatase [unclassified Streptomyces]MCH0567323.1 serine/threonine-protein phosphatase [Streptomyces sp. MUM 2J]MCH0572002.1 serine/threonine-protein phosphatase [Streptomyces sp. MUM 136J]